ncbi:hypothetical protein MTCD1_02355 [Colwellia marinimaniae]|uniref:Uncharacterized protein n=1 Tax=Colwellia marinimaniae TaxID=1513592 RepID=A0ABQ0MWK6_9GAMM|nr:hypothetical protein MTCD1_02355 [Colwellia marinimaniae]
MSKGIWYILAATIAALVAGPEIIISMELMVLVEFLGASTFVLMYISGFKLFFSDVLTKLKKFESHSTFLIPSLHLLRYISHQLPSKGHLKRIIFKCESKCSGHATIGSNHLIIFDDTRDKIFVS